MSLDNSPINLDISISNEDNVYIISDMKFALLVIIYFIY